MDGPIWERIEKSVLSSSSACLPRHLTFPLLSLIHPQLLFRVNSPSSICRLLLGGAPSFVRDRISGPEALDSSAHKIPPIKPPFKTAQQRHASDFLIISATRQMHKPRIKSNKAVKILDFFVVVVKNFI